jgi:hypothetical protein
MYLSQHINVNIILIFLSVFSNDYFPWSQWIGYSKPNATISVKSMGELDMKPFVEAPERKFSNDANMKAASKRKLKASEWCAKWDEYLRDPSWHPFKIEIDKEGNSKVLPLNLMLICFSLI